MGEEPLYMGEGSRRLAGVEARITNENVKGIFVGIWALRAPMGARV